MFLKGTFFNFTLKNRVKIDDYKLIVLIVKIAMIDKTFIDCKLSSINQTINLRSIL